MTKTTSQITEIKKNVAAYRVVLWTMTQDELHEEILSLVDDEIMNDTKELREMAMEIMKAKREERDEEEWDGTDEEYEVN